MSGGLLYLILAGIVTGLVAAVLWLRRRIGVKTAMDAHGAAKVKRRAIVDALGRQDDDAVQREAMRGVKPLKRGRE